MAFEPIPGLSIYLGFVAWGDIGDTTVYKTKRGKVVWLKKTWPDKPPSPKQLERREQWKDAAKDWKALTPDEQQQWHLAARRASLCMHGYNLYQHWHYTIDNTAISTIEPPNPHAAPNRRRYLRFLTPTEGNPMSLSQKQRYQLMMANPHALDVYEKTTASRPVTVLVVPDDDPTDQVILPASCQHQALIVYPRPRTHRQP